jgi:nucleotide-binding universal stress UspA family protein
VAPPSVPPAHPPTALTRLIVPVDGSSEAETALPVAEALATEAGAEVVLLRAPVGDDGPETEAYLARLTGARGSGGSPRVRWLVWYDEPARAIASAVADLQGDLVVMTTHGRRGLRRLLLGSVAEEVIRTAPVPVLLVRGAWPRPGWRPSRVLLPLDGTDRAEAILQVLTWLPVGPTAAVDLLRVVESAGPEDPLGVGPVAGSGPAEAEAYLSDVAARLERQGRQVVSIVRTGRPAIVVPEVARERDARLIAMSTHGRRGVP